jgi:hypothetical protein
VPTQAGTAAPGLDRSVLAATLAASLALPSMGPIISSLAPRLGLFGMAQRHVLEQQRDL